MYEDYIRNRFDWWDAGADFCKEKYWRQSGKELGTSACAREQNMINCERMFWNEGSDTSKRFLNELIDDSTTAKCAKRTTSPLRLLSFNNAYSSCIVRILKCIFTDVQTFNSIDL